MKKFFLFVVGLVVVLLLVLTFALGPIIKVGIEAVGPSVLGVPITVDSVGLSILGGKLTWDRLDIQDPILADQKMLHQESFLAKTSPWDVISGKYVLEDLAAHGTQLTLSRGADGQLGFQKLGPKKQGDAAVAQAKEPTPQEKEQAKNQDWLQQIKKYLEERKQAEQAAKDGKTVGPDGKPVESAQAGIEGQKPPMYLWVKNAKMEDLTIRFVDQTGRAQIPALEQATLQMSNYATSAVALEAPLEFQLSGRLQGQPTSNVAIKATVGKTKKEYNINTADVALSSLDGLAGSSSDVVFDAGTMSVTALFIINGENIDNGQVTAQIKGLQMHAKPGVSTLAGLPADETVKGLNLARDFDLSFKVTGTVTNPNLNWGQALQDVVKSAAKKAAERAVGEAKDKALKEAQDKAQDALGKQGDKLPPGTGDAAKDAVDKAKEGLGGMFGKKKKN